MFITSSFISQEPRVISFSSFVSDPNRVCFIDDQEFCSCDDCSTTFFDDIFNEAS